MQKAKDFCEHLIFMAKDRQSYYDNHFPANCCQIHDRGVISADCIGLVKGLINEPDIWKKLKPSGYYVTPGQIIPDTTEIGILNLCSGVSSDFRKLVPGEYLYMAGHAGVYVGEFEHAGGVCNVVECTTDFCDNGITSSYVTESGRRFDHKGGTEWRAWEQHGRLSKYVDYGSQPEPQPAQDVIYQTYDDVLCCWLDNVEGVSDYAGVFGHDIDCVYANFSGCNLIYRVHTWSGDQWEKYPAGTWLPSVKNREDYAGIIGRPIDGFMIRCDSPEYKIQYRVHLRKQQIWLDWVSGYDLNDLEYGMAGIIGEPIDALQIKAVKLQ